MAYRWPAGTAFKRITLDVEDCWCPVCDRYMYVCDHRYHHLWTLEGPTQVVNRLVRCPDASCASRGRTFSPGRCFKAVDLVSSVEDECHQFCGRDHDYPSAALSLLSRD
jgi:hypothetical protein